MLAGKSLEPVTMLAFWKKEFESFLELGECLLQNSLFISLSANPTKWLNTLKQFVGCWRRIFYVCLTILSDSCLKSEIWLL